MELNTAPIGPFLFVQDEYPELTTQQVVWKELLG